MYVLTLRDEQVKGENEKVKERKTPISHMHLPG
jgi:hypothetical protein